MYVPRRAPWGEREREEGGGGKDPGHGNDASVVRTAGEFSGISRFNEVRRAEWPGARGIIRAEEI